MSKVLFVAAGPYEWGSSRMRAYWVADQMGASVVEAAQLSHNFDRFEQADTVIWQKKIDLDLVEAYRSKSHYWDVCDPLWWWNPQECIEIGDLVDGVIASNRGLADDWAKFYQRKSAYVVPDCIDLRHFTKQREHSTVNPVRLVWFGLSVNRVALYGAAIALSRAAANERKIELTILDDRPDLPFEPVDNFPIYHSRWGVNSENEVIANHDLAILPPYPGPWGQVKSNNKHLTAWACGLPVASGHDYEDLIELIDSFSSRQAVADLGYETLLEQYTIDRAVEKWRGIIGD